MEQLSRSEEQVMAALWACSRAATRREIASHLPPECRWADSTLLNFLLRLEKKNFVRTEKQGNKNLYTPLVRRLTYCGAVSQAHLQTLYDGDIRAMVRSMTMSSSKPSPSGEGGPAGPDEGQPTAITRKRSAAIHSALISPLCGQLPPRGKPYSKSACISHISCQNRLGTWFIWAFSSRRCSMVNALKNRFHIRCQSSSVSSVPGI